MFEGHFTFGRNTNWECPFCYAKKHVLLAPAKKEIHKFIIYAQGAKLYDVSYWSFVRAAKEAQSNYPIRKTAIVDLNILEKFLEENPQVVARLEESRRKRHEK